MITQEEFIGLQKMFRSTERPPFGNLLSRYEMLPRYAILSLARDIPFSTRFYRFFRDTLILLRLTEPINKNSNWAPSLRHAPVSKNSKVVIIWACDYLNQADFRLAFTALKNRFSRFSSPVPASIFTNSAIANPSCESSTVSNLAPISYVPVLITNQADFAFYSRQGWLVEYLPNLSGLGEAYDNRKAQYLAWRYQDARILPISAGMLSEEQWTQLVLGDFGG